MLRAALVALLLLSLTQVRTQTVFSPGQELRLSAYDLDSRRTHLKFARSYIPLCPSHSGYGLLSDQLPFNVTVMEPVVCKQACTVHLTAQDVQRYKWMIKHGYQQFYSLSPQLPALYRNANPTGDKLVSYDLGFPVGWLEDRTTYLVNNQVDLMFNYRRTQDGKIEVLDFVVTEANCTGAYQL